MSEVFTIAPASARPLWFIVAIGVLLGGILLLFGYFAYSSRNTRFEVSQEGLEIQRTVYGRTIAWSDLEVDRAQRVDLRERSDYRPTLRTNGLSVPGYRVGWFRLPRNERGLLFVTDPARVVAVPTRDDYTLLLSVSDPEAFLETLRSAAENRRG